MPRRRICKSSHVENGFVQGGQVDDAQQEIVTALLSEARISQEEPIYCLETRDGLLQLDIVMDPVDEEFSDIHITVLADSKRMSLKDVPLILWDEGLWQSRSIHIPNEEKVAFLHLPSDREYSISLPGEIWCRNDRIYSHHLSLTKDYQLMNYELYPFYDQEKLIHVMGVVCDSNHTISMKAFTCIPELFECELAFVFYTERPYRPVVRGLLRTDGEEKEFLFDPTPFPFFSSLVSRFEFHLLKEV